MMNTPETSSWSKRRVIGAALFVFSVQIGVLFLLGERSAEAIPGKSQQTDFHFVTEEIRDREMFDSVLAGDPTLFALPGQKDFSGEAWLKNKTLDYEPPFWESQPSLLPLKVDSLGEAFVSQVRSNQTTGIRIAEQVLPTSDRMDLGEKVEQNSFFHLGGALVKRGLTHRPSVPSMRNTEPVADTVVQIAVNGAGEIAAARLLSPRNGEPGSLSAAAEKALQIARELRFRPISHGGPTALDWGKVTFRWQTLPLPVTNAVNNLP